MKNIAPLLVVLDPMFEEARKAFFRDQVTTVQFSPTSYTFTIQEKYAKRSFHWIVEGDPDLWGQLSVVITKRIFPRSYKVSMYGSYRAGGKSNECRSETLHITYPNSSKKLLGNGDDLFVSSAMSNFYCSLMRQFLAELYLNQTNIPQEVPEEVPDKPVEEEIKEF